MPLSYTVRMNADDAIHEIAVARQALLLAERGLKRTQSVLRSNSCVSGTNKSGPFTTRPDTDSDMACSAPLAEGDGDGET